MCAKATMEEFEALLNESLEIDTPDEGSVVKGKVIAIEAGQAIIDVGYKMEGRVDLKEFANPGEAPNIAVGDEVEVYLDRVENARGEASISREKARREEAWDRLEKAYAAEERVEGAIFGRVKGGFTVDLGGAVLRILPGYFLLLTAMSVYWIGVKGQHELAPLVPYYLLFLSNFLTEHIPLMTITWSLSVEEQFYLVWPLTMVLLPFLARRRIVLLLGVITLFLAVALWGAAALPRLQTAHAVFALPVMSYTALLSGALAALLLNQRRGYRLLSTICGYSGAPVVFLGLLLVWLQVSPENLKSWPGAVMYVLMALLLVSLVVREDNALRPLLTLAPIRRIGEISYGIYLFHLIGLHVAHETVLHLMPAGILANWLITLLYVPVSLLIAEISFRTFERYFLSLKKRHPGTPA